MTRIPETFNFPNIKELNSEELIELLQRMYMDLAEAINSKPDLYQREVNGVPTDGDVGDVMLAQGSININTTTNKVEMLTNHTSTTNVVWTTLS